MKKRIYIYELDCYKVASEEQIQRMRISPERYFNLEGLPSEELAEKLEEFIWERGKMLAPSSMASEVTYYNNIREFLIDRKIQSLDAREEEKIIRMLKGWMLERGYALSSKKYRPAYDKIGIESPSIVRHMKKILKFLEEEDDRDEQEKDIWTLKNFDFPIYRNPIKNTETINFTKIVQPDIREEVKKVIFMHLKYSPLGTIHSEIAAVKRFSKFLKRKYLDIQSLQDLERMHIEEYLIYLQTEAHDRKNYRSDLYALRRVIEDVGNLYERQYMSELFLSNDFPSTPRHVFKFYSDAEIKRLNEHIFKMDEQICRALIIHQLLGTRISDTLTLKTDCLSMRNKKTKCWSDCIGISFGTGFSGNYWYRIMESCCRRNFNRVSFYGNQQTYRREDWIWRQSSDYCTRYFPWNVEVTDITFGSVWTGGSSINSVDDKKKVYEKKYDPICPISYSCIYG